MQRGKYVLASLVLISFSIFAAPPHKGPYFPYGCKLVGYEFIGNYLYLKGEKSDYSRVYLIYNESPLKITLNHTRKPDPGVSAGWASELDSQQWSAISVPGQTKRFQVSCQIQSGTKYSRVNCSKAIRVCQFTHYGVLDPNLATGGFWIAENQSLYKTLDKMRQRGYELPSKPKSKH